MGVFRKKFGEKWPLDIGSALYRDLLFIVLTNRGYNVIHILLQAMASSWHRSLEKFLENLP